VENLVLADSCNGAKSDHLVVREHLDRWSDRLHAHSDELAHLAADARWPSDRPRSEALLRSTYLHLPRGTPLWVHGTTFVEATGPIELAV
jgi:hypothetical protein